MIQKFFRTNKVAILIVSISVLLIFINYSDRIFFKNEEFANYNSIWFENNQGSEKENFDSVEELIVVDVKGAVKKPGVYEVKPSVRVNDLINLAGGFTVDADETQINLAQRVFDEMVIYVPKVGEELELEVSTSLSASSAEGKVRVNYATKEELQKLKGIGPSKAEAILQYREEKGPFKKAEDLLNVTGIGEKTLENIREDIIVP